MKTVRRSGVSLAIERSLAFVSDTNARLGKRRIAPLCPTVIVCEPEWHETHLDSVFELLNRVEHLPISAVSLLVFQSPFGDWMGLLVNPEPAAAFGVHLLSIESKTTAISVGVLNRSPGRWVVSPITGMLDERMDQGDAAIVLLALSAWITPCRYQLVRFTDRAIELPDPYEQSHARKSPMYAVVRLDRCFREREGGSDLTVLHRSAHHREAHYMYRWASVGIDRHTLPRSPHARRLLALEKGLVPILRRACDVRALSRAGAAASVQAELVDRIPGVTPPPLLPASDDDFQPEIDDPDFPDGQGGPSNVASNSVE